MLQIIGSLLHQCANTKNFRQGILLHAATVKIGMESDVIIAITGLVENEQGEKGFEIFKLMRQQGLVPDHFTFAGLLGPVECTYYNVSNCIQLHCSIVKLGLDYLAFTGNILIAMYSKFDFLEEAEKVFWSVEDKDVISWNTFIIACCRNEDNSRALSFFRDMVVKNDARPDLFTYASVLSAIAGLASMRHGKEIHSHLIRTWPDWDVGVGNALVNMYAKSGSIGSAQAIFERMECRNLVSWNSIITAFANHGLAEKVITLFMEMMRMRLKPDSVTFIGLLTACNHSGLAKEGQYLFDSMSKFYGITPNSEHLCCLVDLLGRAGRLNEAEEYIQKQHIGHDAVVLGSLLSACRLHGDVARGEQTAARLLELDHITTSPYVLLSNLYASDRKWECVAGARKILRGSGLKKEAAHSIVEVKGSFEKFVIGNFSHSRMDEILNLLRILSWRVDEQLLCS